MVRPSKKPFFASWSMNADQFKSRPMTISSTGTDPLTITTRGTFAVCWATATRGANAAAPASAKNSRRFIAAIAPNRL
jgi:hypothetical protein